MHRHDNVELQYDNREREKRENYFIWRVTKSKTTKTGSFKIDTIRSDPYRVSYSVSVVVLVSVGVKLDLKSLDKVRCQSYVRPPRIADYISRTYVWDETSIWILFVSKIAKSRRSKYWSTKISWYKKTRESAWILSWWILLNRSVSVRIERRTSH